MVNERKIIEEIAQTQDFAGTILAYETIAANSMRRVRSSVFANRDFHLGLNRIFQEVKYAHRKEKGPRLNKERTNEGEGETTYIILTANTGLYGGIIYKVFTAFLEEFRKNPGEIMVTGKIGKELLDGLEQAPPYKYFDFSDNKITAEDIKKILLHLNRFGRVKALHGFFKNIILQEPVVSGISGDLLPSEDFGPERPRYFFEPSLEAVAIFFETEIFASLLEQAFHESRLAKLASRIALLDRATVNMDKLLKSLKFRRQQLRHRLYNKKQADAFSGASLWER